MRSLFAAICILSSFTLMQPMTSTAKDLESLTKILFIHHSTGGNLIRQGNLRKLLFEKDPSIELWDHGYNLYSSKFFSKLLAPYTFRTGISNSKGTMTGEDYDIVISNNSPKEYAEIFSRDPTDPTLKNILSYDVILFKNCFPTSKIDSDTKLAEHIKYYNQIRDSLKKYPEKKFIVFTPPPLRSEATQPEYAHRARALADYMTSDSYVKESDNLKVFDFFDLLADREGENTDMLKRKYASWIFIDSHPNKLANEDIAPILVEFILRHS